MWLLFPLILASVHALTLVTAPTKQVTLEPVEGWLNVRLNHFKASNNESFPMRYYYHKRNETDNNIVIYVGEEWETTPSQADGGLAYNIASLIDASVFYTERRYYGQSRPTEETSTSELRYLTIDQSLADLAQFIQYIKSDDFQNGQYKSGKVVLVGCALSGSMATWMRLAYPHLVDVTVSDSGPLYATEDLREYLEVVFGELLNHGGEVCSVSVDQGLTELSNALGTPAGLTQVSNLFNTCSMLSTTSAIDITTFLYFGITKAFSSMVQTGNPTDIAQACTTLINPAVSPLQRLANWVNSQHPNECLETRYTEVVAAYSNTSYDSTHKHFRLWMYQSCVEFGWFPVTYGHIPDALITAVPLQFFHQMCKDFFSAEFTQDFIYSGIVRTNLFYGGLSHIPDYVISVQSTADPLSPVGPKEIHATEKSPVFVFKGASQCETIRSYASEPELNEIQMEVLNYINFFINDMPLTSAASTFISSVSLMLTLITAVVVSI